MLRWIQITGISITLTGTVMPALATTAWLSAESRMMEAVV